MPWVYFSLRILSQAFSLLPYYLILNNICSTLLFYSIMTLPRPLTGNILFDFVTWRAALRPSAGNTLRVGRPAALCLQAFMWVSLSRLCFRGFASLPFWPSCTIALGCAVHFWWYGCIYLFLVDGLMALLIIYWCKVILFAKDNYDMSIDLWTSALVLLNTVLIVCDCALASILRIWREMVFISYICSLTRPIYFLEHFPLDIEESLCDLCSMYVMKTPFGYFDR